MVPPSHYWGYKRPDGLPANPPRSNAAPVPGPPLYLVPVSNPEPTPLGVFGEGLLYPTIVQLLQCPHQTHGVNGLVKPHPLLFHLKCQPLKAGCGEVLLHDHSLLSSQAVIRNGTSHTHTPAWEDPNCVTTLVKPKSGSGNAPPSAQFSNSWSEPANSQMFLPPPLPPPPPPVGWRPQQRSRQASSQQFPAPPSSLPPFPAGWIQQQQSSRQAPNQTHIRLASTSSWVE